MPTPANPRPRRLCLYAAARDWELPGVEWPCPLEVAGRVTSGSCFDECLRQADACGASLTDCEAGCQQPTVGCERASHDYNACLLQLPTECRPWFEADPREIEDIPCGYEGIAAWVCGK